MKDTNPQRSEQAQKLLDSLTRGTIDRRRCLAMAGWLGLAGLLSPLLVDVAAEAGQVQRRNRDNLRNSYDYVIAGGGAAGCVLARRLVDAGASVLVIEAGGTDEIESVRNPAVWFTNIGGENDWGYTTPPSAFVDGRSLLIGTGKLLGGGSSINACVWSRGAARDFDNWAYAGCYGWSFRELLPLYKSIEDWEGGADDWRGAGGLLRIQKPRNPHPTATAWVQAAGEMGLPVLDDVNGGTLEGAGLCNLTIQRDGSRASAARAYLHPVLQKSNLTLLLNSRVTALTFEGERCTGVRILRGDSIVEVKADKEVLVTAGGIGSAHLLMLSGIGSEAELKAAGVSVQLDLAGVGKNLHDHPLLEGVIFQYKGPMPPPPAFGNAAEATLFHRSRADAVSPDLQPVLIEIPVVTPPLRKQFGIVPSNAFTIAPGLVRPASRGSVRLASGEFQTKPIVDVGFLREEADMRALLVCIEFCRELGHQKAFDDIREKELIPAAKLEAKELRQFAMRSITSYFHPVGSCRMGVDALSVVDPELRVYGTSNLRVCDSSVMPTITTGNTCAPTMLIAEKASKLILSGT